MGVNIKVIQELLGHANISITLDIYSHVTPDMQNDAMKELNRQYQTDQQGDTAIKSI
jgi:integrase